MSEKDPNPFQRRVMTREPGIVGAQWWNEGLTAMSDPVTRRKALQALAVLGGSVAVGGLLLSAADDDDEYLELHDALSTQRQQGWNFGATDDSLSFTGQANATLKTEDLRELATELAPKQDALKPFYQATLFQSVGGNQMGAGSLRNELRPIYTPAMDTAFHQGQALEGLFAKQEEAALATAVLVDLPGPESVAFAAGLAGRFEPVFTFDNWPHPLGVVPAHLTLVAAGYYQPMLRRLAQQRRSPAPPVFVLDNQRLRPYTDERTQFDNRYMARLPTAEQLRKLGIQHVLYVVPGGSTPPRELDDLNEDFVAWRAAGPDVKLVAASDFQPDPTENVPPATTSSTGQPAATDGGTAVAATDAGTGDAGTSALASASPATQQPTATTDAGTATDAGTSALASASTATSPAPRAWYFGGSRAAHEAFWLLYPWGRTQTSHESVRGISSAGILSTKELARVPPNLSGGYAYEPSRRTTMFSSVPRGASGARPLPSGFGKVAMRVSSKSRAILGPAFTSRSSWSRSSSYSSSGG